MPQPRLPFSRHMTTRRCILFAFYGALVLLTLHLMATVIPTKDGGQIRTHVHQQHFHHTDNFDKVMAKLELLNQTVVAFVRILGFFYSNLEEMSLDGVAGVRIVEGMLLDLKILDYYKVVNRAIFKFLCKLLSRIIG